MTTKASGARAHKKETRLRFGLARIAVVQKRQNSRRQHSRTVLLLLSSHLCPPELVRASSSRLDMFQRASPPRIHRLQKLGPPLREDLLRAVAVLLQVRRAIAVEVQDQVLEMVHRHRVRARRAAVPDHPIMVVRTTAARTMVALAMAAQAKVARALHQAQRLASVSVSRSGSSSLSP